MKKTVKQYLQECNEPWAKKALKYMPIKYKTGQLDSPTLSDLYCFHFFFEEPCKKIEYYYFKHKYLKR